MSVAAAGPPLGRAPSPRQPAPPPPPPPPPPRHVGRGGGSTLRQLTIPASVRAVPAFLSVGPRHGGAPPEDQLDFFADEHADLVAVRVDGAGQSSRCREQQRPRRRVAPVHHLVRSGGPGRKADQVS